MRLVFGWVLKLLGFLFIFCSVSCNKEIEQGGDPLSAIRGQWVFMSSTVTTESVTTYSIDTIVYRNRLKANYITYNNNGTVTITAGTMSGSDLRFDVSTIAYFTFYVGDDNDEDSVEVSFSNTMESPYSLQKNFELIGKDSVYFPAGTLMNIPDINESGSSSMNLPQGGRIRTFDNSVKIITTSSDEYSYTEDGITFHTVKTETVETDLARLN